MVRVPLVAYLVVVLVMMFLEESVDLRAVEVSRRATGGRGGWSSRRRRFQAADGTRLHGWYVPPGARRAVLFLHGNGGNITHRADALRMLHDRVGVVGADLRLPRLRAERGASRASRACWPTPGPRGKWLAAREGVPESDLVLMGESLGGAVAVELAAADGARALVLESTFSSVARRGGPSFSLAAGPLLMRTRLDSAARIAAITARCWRATAGRTRSSPLRWGGGCSTAANEPKQFITIPDRDHNDPRPREYYDALAEFLGKYKG